jgi:signal transduction histidine kinase
MKEVVKPIVDEMRPLLIKKRMNVELQACGENPVVCDRDLMRTVFSNLINNAIKYGTAGTDVRCEIVVNATALEVGVFNEGSGIPADKLVEVFGEFTRFDISGVGGTGLGLYVVKKLVDMHHGAVRAESGYMIDGEAVVYDDFYKNDKYFGLREKDGELKRFAKFVVRIPLSKAADPKDGSSNGSTSGNNQ